MADGTTGQSLAGLLDLDMESIRKLSTPGSWSAPSVRGLREVAAGRQGNELNAVDENARLKIVQRKNYELKNAALEGSLVSMDDITEAWGIIFRAIKAMVLSFPARCHEKLPHLKGDDVETIRKVANKVLTETSKMLPDRAPMPQTGSALANDYAEGG